MRLLSPLCFVSLVVRLGLSFGLEWRRSGDAGGDLLVRPAGGATQRGRPAQLLHRRGQLRLSASVKLKRYVLEYTKGLV